MYKILVSKKAQEEFAKLPNEIKKRIIGVLERASINPYQHARRLSGDPAYRLRAGKYRIIVELDEKKKTIDVLRIGHRETIYQ